MTDQLTSGAAQYRAVLGNTELLALLVARLLSGIGDQLARVVLALYVLDRSDGNALLAASVLAVSYVPSTFGFAFLGSLADRFPRRSVMLWADLARALIVTVLAIAVSRDANFLAVMLLLLGETFSAPALSARSSLLPDAARSPVEYQAVVGSGNHLRTDRAGAWFPAGRPCAGRHQCGLGLALQRVDILDLLLDRAGLCRTAAHRCRRWDQCEPPVAGRQVRPAHDRCHALDQGCCVPALGVGRAVGRHRCRGASLRHRGWGPALGGNGTAWPRRQPEQRWGPCSSPAYPCSDRCD